MMGNIFSNLHSPHFLPVNRLEINDFSRSSNGPGEDIEQVQGRNGFKVGEDGINPDHTEDAITIKVGTTVLPSPREAAMVQSIKAENA